MKLSAAIMAHPVRAHAVDELLDQLDRDVPVSWDPIAEPSRDPMQRWRVARAAWEAHDPDADWHIVLQDDIYVSADLLAGLEKALDQIGADGLVSAYTGTGRPDQLNVRRALSAAKRKSHSWMDTKSLCWGCAIVAPVWTIPDMLDWTEDHVERHEPPRSNTDYAIGVYYRDIMGWRTWYTVPSLVEHRGLPSLVGHGTERVAHQFHDGSALDIDWAATPSAGLDPNVIP